MTDKAIRAAKLTAAGILDKARARTAVTRAGGQIAPSKYLPNVPRQVHADGGRENGDGIQAAELVAKMLREGRASEVTNDHLSAADPQHLSKLYETGKTGMHLPMDHASRMERAKAMGFGSDPKYHGTGADFQNFHNSRRGNYFSDRPEIADIYAETAGKRNQSTRGQLANADANVIPALLREPTLEVSDQGVGGGGYSTDNLAKHFPEVERSPLGSYASRLDDAAKQKGYSTVKIANMDDLGGMQDQWRPVDPANIRSRFARFDPRLAHLSHLSAATGGRIGHADGGKVGFLAGNHPLVPDVLYHGTARDIQSFDPNAKRSYDVDPSNPEETDTGWFGKGHYFTASPKLAGHYASEGAKRQGNEGANILPAHVAMKNPFVVDMKAYDSGAKTLDSALSRAGVPMHPRGWRKPSEQTAALVGMGHDGVIATREGKPEEYVAFHPTQIKSAISATTFDPTDPDITKADGGRIGANKGGSMGARADFLAGNHPEVPNVVYHGSTADFNEFRPLSHFGTMQAAHDRFKSSPKQQTNQNVIPAHISLKNPLDVGLEDDWQDNRDTIRQAADVMLNSKNPDRYYMMAAEKLQNLAYDPRWREHQLPLERQAAQILRDAGHDGIIYNNSVEDPGSRSFITLHPSQVKSSIGNQGTFDPNETDMTKAEGGAVGDDGNFQNWFGNSVTHTDGQPHVFYTGTSKDKDFTSHNVGRHGAWFTRDPAEASSYAEQNDSQGHKHDGWKVVKTNTASRVIPAYVKAENPYTGELPAEVMRDNYKAAQSDWFDTLRAKGHDAWMPASQNGNLVVALKEPQQIKSIFNNGKFDPKQKHMNKAEGGEVEDNKPVDMGVARALRRFNQDSSGPPPEVEGIFNRLAAAKDAAQEAHEAAHNAGAFDNVQIGDVYKYKPLDSYAPMKVVGHGMVHVSRWGGTNPPKYVYKDHYPVAQVEYQDAAKERRNTAIELLEDRDRYDFLSGKPRAVRKRGGAVDAALAATRRFTKDGKAATLALKPKGK